MSRALGRWIILCLALAVAGTTQDARGQSTESSDGGVITLTLQDAIEIALERNYVVRGRRLDVDEAEWLIKEGYGRAMPQLSATSRYQRNLASPNPFAGSDAGSLFSGLSSLDWISYNEDARTDLDPTTNPLSLDVFRDRQEAGLEDANIVLNPTENPFLVDNLFDNRLSLTQTLYDGSLFGGIQAAKTYRDISRAGLAREVQVVVKDTKMAFYAALFSAEQSAVVEKSVERTGRTVKEASLRLAQGISSKYDKLSAEVELANLESDLLRARNAVENGLDNLKMLLGLPMSQAIVLKGSLQDDAGMSRFQEVSLEDALEDALVKRPDIEQAALSVELNDINARVERSARMPVLNAFVDVGYVGNVPDSRTRIFNVDNDPFVYGSESNNFFDSSYWSKSLSVGLSLRWTIFDGFQTKSKAQQAVIDRRRSEIQYEQLKNQVRREIQAARRDLFAAEQQMSSQSRNVSRAELNYEYASTRVREGVSSRLEERQASDLLDESRLNYNRAVFDYLMAQASFEAAVGSAGGGSSASASAILMGSK